VQFQRAKHGTPNALHPEMPPVAVPMTIFQRQKDPRNDVPLQAARFLPHVAKLRAYLAFHHHSVKGLQHKSFIRRHWLNATSYTQARLSDVPLWDSSKVRLVFLDLERYACDWFTLFGWGFDKTESCNDRKRSENTPPINHTISQHTAIDRQSTRSRYNHSLYYW
jgi:hypothetical protein